MLRQAAVSPKPLISPSAAFVMGLPCINPADGIRDSSHPSIDS